MAISQERMIRLIETAQRLKGFALALRANRDAALYQLAKGSDPEQILHALSDSINLEWDKIPQNLLENLIIEHRHYQEKGNSNLRQRLNRRIAQGAEDLTAEYTSAPKSLIRELSAAPIQSYVPTNSTSFLPQAAKENLAEMLNPELQSVKEGAKRMIEIVTTYFHTAEFPPATTSEEKELAKISIKHELRAAIERKEMGTASTQDLIAIDYWQAQAQASPPAADERIF